MSCILRVWGTDLAIDDLSKATSLNPYRIDRRGEPRRQPGRVFDRSCAHFEVSDLGFQEFEGQIKDAVAYLERNLVDLGVLLGFPGVQGAALDFGLAWRDAAAQTDELPARLLALSGNLGIGIDLSHYPISEGGTASEAGA